MSTKPNKNRPSTLVACEAAHQRGVSEGNGEGLAIYLTVMRDKFGKSSEKLYDIWKATEAACEAISRRGKLVAEYEREQRELIKRDICPQMQNVATAFKAPVNSAKKQITVGDEKSCYRQGREAGWQFATLVFLRAIRAECKYTKTQLLRVYDAACDQRESIRKKYIDLADLETVLLEEAKIKVE